MRRSGTGTGSGDNYRARGIDEDRALRAGEESTRVRKERRERLQGRAETSARRMASQKL